VDEGLAVESLDATSFRQAGKRGREFINSHWSADVRFVAHSGQYDRR
jgi:hypothetical protein